MKVVTKKIDTEWFNLVESDKKKFELRVADFDLEEGDVIRLEEYIGQEPNRTPTGRVIEKKVTYLRKVDLKDWAKKQPEIMEKGFYVIQFD